MNTKKAICFCISSQFVEFAEALLKSFWKFNSSYDGEFLIFGRDLEDKHKRLLFDLCKNKLTWVDCSISEDYVIDRPQFYDAYLKLEIYNPRHNVFEKLLLLDVDILISGNILDIFNIDCDFGAVPVFHKKSKKMRSKEFNSGVIYLGNRKFVTDETYNILIDKASRKHAFADQSILNEVFPGFYKLPKKYNTESRVVEAQKNSMWNEAVIRHFVGPTKYQPIYQREKRRLRI